jgi:type 1 fimbriae regulatory protein FimB/type 1 fimbriae regulatory protein FimE
LRKAAKSIGRQGHRDDTLVLMMFRHALRVSEAISLRWDQVDLKLGLLHVLRVKNGIPSTHPLRGIELRALRQLKRESSNCSYVFVSERNAPLAARTVHHIVARAGKLVNLFTVHPHMLRHSTGFYLANEGQDTRAIQSYMGHANINNTIRYTELSPSRFNKFWND